MHLCYLCMTAGIDCNENRHPQVVMKELGITYQHSTPQSMYDQWWFWNCKNMPKKLPEYLVEFKKDPIDAIGHGLSREEALEIKKGEKNE